MGLEERTRPQTGSVPERPPARADWRQMLGVGIIASILGIAAGILIDWFPLQASTQAPTIDTLWDVLLIASIPVFVGVMGCLCARPWWCGGVVGASLFGCEPTRARAGGGAPPRTADPRQQAPGG